MLRGPSDVFRSHVLPRLLAAPGELIVDALPPLTPHMRFLEIGAGGGVVARAVVERIAGLGRLIAIDDDAALAAELPSGPRRAARAQAGFPRLPFVDASFDVVIANLVLGDVARDPQRLDEVRRVLRAGGWLLCTATLAGSCDALIDVVSHVCASGGHDDFAAAANAARRALPTLDDVVGRVAAADIAVHGSGVEERALGIYAGHSLLKDPLIGDVVLPAIAGVPLPPAVVPALTATVDQWFPQGLPVVVRHGLVVGRVAR